MKRPGEKSVELRLLVERLMLTLDFFENVEDFPIAGRIRAKIEAAEQQGDFRTMRLLAKEIDAMTVALPRSAKEGLDAILRDRLHVNNEAEQAALRQQATAALTRGRIRSEKERQRLQHYLERLEAHKEDPALSAALMRLLSQG